MRAFIAGLIVGELMRNEQNKPPEHFTTSHFTTSAKDRRAPQDFVKGVLWVGITFLILYSSLIIYIKC